MKNRKGRGNSWRIRIIPKAWKMKDHLKSVLCFWIWNIILFFYIAVICEKTLDVNGLQNFSERTNKLKGTWEISVSNAFAPQGKKTLSAPSSQTESGNFHLLFTLTPCLTRKWILIPKIMLIQLVLCYISMDGKRACTSRKPRKGYSAVPLWNNFCSQIWTLNQD